MTAAASLAAVEAGRGFVEEQQARAGAAEGAGQGQAAGAGRGDRSAPRSPMHGVVALGQVGDEDVGLGGDRRRPDLLGEAAPSSEMLLATEVGEEVGRWGTKARWRRHLSRSSAGQVDAAHQDAASDGVMKPSRRWSRVLLPAPLSPTSATRSPGRDGEGHVEQGGVVAARIAHGHAFEADLGHALRHRPRPGGGGLGALQQGEGLVGRRRRPPSRRGTGCPSRAGAGRPRGPAAGPAAPSSGRASPTAAAGPPGPRPAPATGTPPAPGPATTGTPPAASSSWPTGADRPRRGSRSPGSGPGRTPAGSAGRAPRRGSGRPAGPARPTASRSPPWWSCRPARRRRGSAGPSPGRSARSSGRRRTTG